MIIGGILAGGTSRRMGCNKAWVAWRGQPLVTHAIAALAPQVAAVMVNVRADDERAAGLGLPLVLEPTPARGPLGGVLALLRALPPTADWLVSVPVDQPCLPADLVVRLTGTVAPLAVAAGGPQVWPLIAAWRPSLAAPIARALDAGDYRVRPVLNDLGAVHVRWDSPDPDWGRNFNSPDDLRDQPA